jgi:hypothetical protein
VYKIKDVATKETWFGEDLDDVAGRMPYGARLLSLRDYWAGGIPGLVVLDECDLPVPPEIVIARAEAQRPRHRPWWRIGRDYDPATDFRRRPVTGTGKRGWRGSLRHMRTRQEIAANTFLASDEDALEHGVVARGSRRRNTLPTAWDDYWRDPERGWKKHRRHQWR